MTVHISPEQERVIGQAIDAGIIRRAEDVVDIGLETIRQWLDARLTSQPPIDLEQWLQDFHTWVRSHSQSTPLLSDEAISRESIYGTRGL